MTYNSKESKERSQKLLKKEQNFLTNYKIEETIGQGTFGKVKLGIHLPTGEKVAIKILEKTLIKDKDSQERVNREIRFLKKIRHPNIIQLYEIFENSFAIYLVMEYAKFGEFFDYIVKNTRLNENEASMFFAQIIDGVEYLNTHKIVHRDLKPENLLLNENNLLKIIDFGLSNSCKEGDLLKTPCGSPCYAAPEMLQGNKYDGLKIDIWSSGIILYAMVCGYLPFEDEDNSKLYQMIIECNLEFPFDHSDNCVEMIRLLLTTDPDKRITIDQIKNHYFYLQGKKILNAMNQNIKYNLNEIHSQTLNKLTEMKFNKNEVIGFLNSNEFNNVTTSYYLIFNKIKYEKYLMIIQNSILNNDLIRNRSEDILENEDSNLYKNEICATEFMDDDILQSNFNFRNKSKNSKNESFIPSTTKNKVIHDNKFKKKIKNTGISQKNDSLGITITSKPIVTENLTHNEKIGLIENLYLKTDNYLNKNDRYRKGNSSSKEFLKNEKNFSSFKSIPKKIKQRPLSNLNIEAKIPTNFTSKDKKRDNKSTDSKKCASPCVFNNFINVKKVQNSNINIHITNIKLNSNYDNLIKDITNVYNNPSTKSKKEISYNTNERNQRSQGKVKPIRNDNSLVMKELFSENQENHSKLAKIPSSKLSYDKYLPSSVKSSASKIQKLSFLKSNSNLIPNNNAVSKEIRNSLNKYFNREIPTSKKASEFIDICSPIKTLVMNGKNGSYKNIKSDNKGFNDYLMTETKGSNYSKQKYGSGELKTKISSEKNIHTLKSQKIFVNEKTNITDSIKKTCSKFNIKLKKVDPLKYDATKDSTKFTIEISGKSVNGVRLITLTSKENLDEIKKIFNNF